MYSVTYISLFIVFSVISAFFAWIEYEECNVKEKIFWSIVCCICLSFLVIEIAKPYWQIKNREKYYSNLLTASNSIKDPYVKTEIDKVVKSINNGNKKEKIIVTMTNDFHTLNRKREYEEIIKTIRSSGFKIDDEIKDCDNIPFANKCHLTTKIEVW